MAIQNKDILLKHLTQRLGASALIIWAHTNICGLIGFIRAQKHLYSLSLNTSWDQQAEYSMAHSLQ